MMTLLAGMIPWRGLIECLIGVALVAGITIAAHSVLEHERELGRGEVRAEYVRQLHAAQDAAKLREAELTTQRDKAITDATQRDQTIRTLAAKSGVAADGLRDTIAALGVRVSSATGDALRDTARTYGQLLTACDGEQRSMAIEAERANSDKRTLIEAWPRDEKTNR